MINLFRKSILAFSLFGLVFSTAAHSMAGGVDLTNGAENYHPNRIIVKLKKNSQLATNLHAKEKPSTDDLTGTEWAALKTKHKINKINRVFSDLHGVSAQKRAAKVAGKFSRRQARAKTSTIPDLENVYTLNIDSNGNLPQAITDLRANPDIDSAELDFKVGVSMKPNDPMYNQLWGLQPSSTNAEAAWNLTLGANVLVAIVDSGVDYNHSDLSANAWVNMSEIPNNGIDDDANGYVDDYYGYDFHANDNDPRDENGHGTHVAGTVTAVGNNGIGVIGIAPKAKFMSIQGLGAAGWGYSSNLAKGIYYAVNMGADVINNSWGGGGYNTMTKDAIDYAYSMGVVVVAAAGNDNSQYIHYPSGYDNVISVTATTSLYSKASFSNYGTRVDVAAPGVSVLSTMPEYTVYANTEWGLPENYGRMNGTSMASPHVAGLAALILSMHPTYTIDQVVNAITATSDSALFASEYIGTGLIDAQKATSLPAPPETIYLEITNPAYSVTTIASKSLIGDAVGSSYTLAYSAPDSSPYITKWTEFGSGNAGANTTLGVFDVAGLTSGEYFIKLSAVGSDGLERIHMVKLRYEEPPPNPPEPDPGELFACPANFQ